MPDFSDLAGFGVSQPQPYDINAGEATNGNPVDFGRPYGFLIIGCLNPDAAAADSDTYSIRLGYDSNGAMLPLNDDDGVLLEPEIGGDTGGFWRRYFVGAAQRVQLVMSANVSSELRFVIIGVDAGLR